MNIYYTYTKVLCYNILDAGSTKRIVTFLSERKFLNMPHLIYKKTNLF